MTTFDRYEQLDRLDTAVLKLARVNLAEGGALDGLHGQALQDALDDEAGELLAGLIARVEAECENMRGGCRHENLDALDGATWCEDCGAELDTEPAPGCEQCGTGPGTWRVLDGGRVAFTCSECARHAEPNGGAL